MITATALGEQHVMSKRNDDSGPFVEGETEPPQRSQRFRGDLSGLPACEPDPSLKGYADITAAIRAAKPLTAEEIETGRLEWQRNERREARRKEREGQLARKAAEEADALESQAVLESLDHTPLLPLLDDIEQAERSVSALKAQLDLAKSKQQSLLGKKQGLASKIGRAAAADDEARIAHLLGQGERATAPAAQPLRRNLKQAAKDSALLTTAIERLEADIDRANSVVREAHRAMHNAVAAQIRVQMNAAIDAFASTTKPLVNALAQLDGTGNSPIRLEERERVQTVRVVRRPWTTVNGWYRDVLTTLRAEQPTQPKGQEP
jgi:hypothetical protein